jgi:hypothetical protein
MKVLRRRVRSFFALQAILMFANGGFRLAGSLSRDSIIFASAHCSAGLMFLGAWLTTRKTSPYRNPWAVAASLICIATGAYIGWTAHLRGSFSQSGWFSMILGLAGLYLYSQGGRAPRATLATTSAD